MKISAVVRRGKAVGALLAPHRHRDGLFVVSLSRFERDYVRVRHEHELVKWIRDGYSVRMSGPTRRAPSLISPGSIRVEP